MKNSSFCIILVSFVLLVSKVEGNPKFKIGGGAFNVEASDLPIFASLQEDSEWTPYFSIGVEFPLATWLAFEINGALVAGCRFADRSIDSRYPA